MLGRDRFTPRRGGTARRLALVARAMVIDFPRRAAGRVTGWARGVYVRRPELIWTRRWHARHPFRLGLRRLVIWMLATAVLAAIVVAFLSFLKTSTTWSPIVDWANEHKRGSGWGGEIVGAILFTSAALTLGLGVFLASRYRRVTRRYVRFAKESPTELVQTAGNIVGEVVGRDDLCSALQTELRTKETRRPHVLVGGLGVGKTAVLVQLTNLLARRGAVPVPVRLRDVDDREELDFLELARERFQHTVRPCLRSDDEGDKVWKQLLKDDRVVVLADGLEEAFADRAPDRARHHRVRVAIRRAAEAKYPLIVASRPHDALRALDAAITHLEPLNEDAALDYVRGEEPALDETVADRLINHARITDAPLYLRIARELNDEDLLKDPVIAAEDDRLTLRSVLVDEWLHAVEKARFHATERVPLDEVERQRTIEHLSALALIGLLGDTQQVRFDMKASLQQDLEATLDEEFRRHATAGDALHGAPIPELQAAASKGVQLELVEPITNGVRFPHSIMQAFLGARMLAAAIGTDDLDAALKEPGRELLLALSLFARRALADRDGAAAAEQVRTMLEHAITRVETGRAADEARWLDMVACGIEIETELRLHAHRHGAAGAGDGDRPAAVVAVATAGRELELESRPLRAPGIAEAPGHAWGGTGSILGRARAGHWRSIRTRDDTTLDAKGNLVQRLGDAARRLADADPAGTQLAYECLYDISVAEVDYGLALAAAQEIGEGGDVAWDALSGRFIRGTGLTEDFRRWTTLLRQGRGGAARDGVRGGDGIHAEYVRQAWLLPMLLGSSRERRDDVDARLMEWVRRVGCEPGDEAMPLSIEAALAQGFKHAANRRPHHSHENVESRRLLQRHARTMVARARFWYARMSLVHALALWEIARIRYPGHVGHELAERAQDPHAIVAGWMRRTGAEGTDEEHHRFVREAADLAQRAIETCRPDGSLWIDEIGVVNTVGARARGGERYASKRLWIMPSAGWMALDRRARELVADVLIVLNLAERDGNAEEREEGLKKANVPDLPKCISGERVAHLKPSSTAGLGDDPNPGQTCRAHCHVALCPYPPRGRQPYREEVSEAFCRRQIVANRWLDLRRRGAWQQAPRVELRRFWAEMERRARI